MAAGERAVGRLMPTGELAKVSARCVAEALAGVLGDSLGVGAAVTRARLLAPIDREEVWGAGVTYTRSRDARIDEARASARDHYAAVYDADRAELFFKASPHRVVGPDSPIMLRGDSTSTVPEPEFALWLDRDLKLLGVGLGNDLTARDLEAENPLYLPQAKVWKGSCALGPWVVACDGLEELRSLRMTLTVRRDGQAIFEGSMEFASMRRHPSELIEQLGRFNEFPHGVVLLTGTGIVPPDDLALRPGDELEISSPELGDLRNHATLAIRSG